MQALDIPNLRLKKGRIKLFAKLELFIQTYLNASFRDSKLKVGEGSAKGTFADLEIVLSRLNPREASCIPA